MWCLPAFLVVGRGINTFLLVPPPITPSPSPTYRPNIWLVHTLVYLYMEKIETRAHIQAQKHNSTKNVCWCYLKVSCLVKNDDGDDDHHHHHYRDV